MFEIIISIIVIGCIIYLFKGEFFRRKVGVTVVENLPLDIFKKKNKKKDSKEDKDENIKELKNDEEVENIKEKDFHNKEAEVYENAILEEKEDENISEEVKSDEDSNNIDDLITVDIIDENKNEIEGIEEIKIDIDEKMEENIKNYINTEELEEGRDISTEETIVTVYWTPKGKNYHMSSTCRTLARSKVINSGTLEECDRQYICEHCK